MKGRIRVLKHWFLSFSASIVVAGFVVVPAFAGSSSILACQNNLEISIHQPTGDLTQLYHQAEMALPAFGRFVDDVVADGSADRVIVGLKSFERSKEKTDGRKGGDSSLILDILRSTLICKNMGQVYQTLARAMSLASQDGVEIIQIKDRFLGPKETGYRDINVRVKIPLSVKGQSVYQSSYHIAELQIHLKPLYELKKAKGDTLYHKIRLVQELAVQEHRDLNSSELAQVESWTSEHLQLYDDAYSEAAAHSLP